MPVSAPTLAELKTAAETEIQTIAPELNDFREGSALDAISGAGAILGDTVIRHVTHVALASFLETAEGADLDAWIVANDGPVRRAASAAAVPLTITRGAYVGAYTLASGSAVTGTAANGSTVTFTTDAAVTIAAPAGTASVAATCSVTGPSGNVAAGTLNRCSTLPTGLTISQAARASGGAAAESDTQYRARYRLFLKARARGVPAALEYAALSTAGVSYASVNEDNIAESAGGYVALYIADSTGEGSALLAAAVYDSLDVTEIDGVAGVRAAGVRVDVISAAREDLVNLEYTVRVVAGSPVSVADVKTAILAYFDTLSPNQTHYPSAVEEAIRQISDDVLDALQTNPSGARAPTSAYNSLRTADDGTDITVTLVEV